MRFASNASQVFMKLFRRFLFALLVILSLVGVIGYYCWYLPKFDNGLAQNKLVKKTASHTVSQETYHQLKQRIHKKLKNLQPLLQSNRYDSKHCFLVDVTISSGKNRFFVYNLVKDSIEAAGLVTHGSGSDVNGKAAIFSNIEGSNCTSLGRYSIGGSYNGKFGLAYKLYGLDVTNSRAYQRFVVLHAHACVPNDEVAPLRICESLGCPTVSPDFLQLLKKYIDRTGKPILLYIYQ